MSADRQPFRAPRAPEWVYNRALLTDLEATATDEDLALEEMIERSGRHSLDGFDPEVVDLG
jgi:hypothetical protein